MVILYDNSSANRICGCGIQPRIYSNVFVEQIAVGTARIKSELLILEKYLSQPKEIKWQQTKPRDIFKL